MRKGRIFLYLIVAVGLSAAAWMAGLLLFVGTVAHLNEPSVDADLQPTEAIVVLTGGSERLSSGLELLIAGKGKKLLVSGVHQGLTLERLLANQQVPAELRACCIALDYAADNTIGNAEETARWMKAEGFSSLRLVTAHYHMPRSLIVFRDLMPDIAIVPYPVAPESVHLADWWSRSGTANLLVTEYNKFLLVALRDRMGGLL